MKRLSLLGNVNKMFMVGHIFDRSVGNQLLFLFGPRGGMEEPIKMEGVKIPPKIPIYSNYKRSPLDE
jgi:hypothetical protein